MLDDNGIGKQRSDTQLLGCSHVLRSDFHPTQAFACVADRAGSVQQYAKQGRYG